ncbi:hypothetical protein MNBD_NITROSPINAE01-537 [hydrothermal vent metagenome]|uniref:Uncharacterized protein n=1 Tax=hydrothermal vent metagenome TaxID=652676 RepID=A0A3B1CIT2_9ZZZZ
MKLAMVIYTGPEQANTATLIGIARSARAKGNDVTVFAMSAGVRNLAREDFVKLADDGVKIAVCDHNRTGFNAPADVDGVSYGSQYDLAGYVNGCDRFLSFT